MSATPPRTNSPFNPSTPPSLSRTRSLTYNGPAPALNRQPSASRPSTPESRYPPTSRLTPQQTTPLRYEIGRTYPSTHTRTASSSTAFQAANTAIPATPPQAFNAYRTPPSSFQARLNEVVELRSLPSQDTAPARQRSESPFHDRHSIEVIADPGDDEESHFSSTRQRTMPGYHFAGMSPDKGDYKEELDFGPELDEPTMISEKRRSLYPAQPITIPISTRHDHPDLFPPDTVDTGTQPPVRSGPPPVRPRFRALFALSTPRDLLLILLPACILSIAASLVPPFMSMTIGDAFQVMGAYPLFTGSATQEERDALYWGVREPTIKLALAGLYAVVVNYAKTVMWQRHGEVIASRLRRRVFEGVQKKQMEWFDMGMGMREDSLEDGDSVGAGGLMSKFTKETDDVRIGTSQQLGLFVQNLFAFILCFILALVRAPVLALVSLCTIPLVVILQIATQILASPLYASERRAFAEASTDVERSTNAIATVKAHNAQASELARFDKIIGRVKAVLVKQAVLWGFNLSVTDFLILGTFVSGFWYGAKVVRDGTVSSGTVMTVFWAALLTASYLQQTVPCLTLITKAKMSMASLTTVIQDVPARSSSAVPFSPASSPSLSSFRHSAHGKPRPNSMAKIRPAKCHGEFNLRSISFAYPSRPDVPVLRDITLFIPPGETTFIVGGSGSGKSTIAQLLLRLYLPEGGDITLDNQSFGYLDDSYTSEHIAAVQQGCILFDMSVHDNVALGLAGAAVGTPGQGRRPKDVSREEVIQACKMAMIHDFIASLPEGYETRLGTSGSSLSGGQRQRMAIARARIRDPSILILDEATSALDATSRVAVFENMKSWRKNRTTIVITHDLSQIVADDFVYVMKDGVVAEQGFRSDLMRKTPLHDSEWGIFAGMAAEQAIEPLPTKEEEFLDEELATEELLDMPERLNSRPSSIIRATTPSLLGRPQSLAYFDILESYSQGARFSAFPDAMQQRSSNLLAVPGQMTTAQKRLSWAPSDLQRAGSRQSVVYSGSGSHRGSRSSFHPTSRPASRMSRQVSFEGSPYSTSAARRSLVHASPWPARPDSTRYSTRLYDHTHGQNNDDDLKFGSDLDIKATLPLDDHGATPDKRDPLGPVPGIMKILLPNLAIMPRKWLLALGLLGSLAHGISTPIWASFLTRLMQIVATGGTDPSLIRDAFIVLAISAAQGLANYTQVFALHSAAAHWTAQIRSTAYGNVLTQDKAFFDLPQNSPAALVQHIIKDADDMRNLIAQIAGKFVVFISMISLGLIWAMVIQWKLTLVGLAIAPVFGGIVVLNEILVGRAEGRNKMNRDRVAKMFYESVSSIRGIRAMGLESVFREKFTEEAAATEVTGKRTGWFIAIGESASTALPLVAIALLNWVGCLFMLGNVMNYGEMLMVFNLVLFTLTFGSQALDFIPMLAKVKVAARDFNRIYYLSSTTSESTGSLRFPISGSVTFDNVGFSYPTRADVPVLQGTSFRLEPGECIAIVGPSGSGKSTIAALLQRLYEPTSGSIRIAGKHDISSADIKWLRNHIAVVSQSANLFDSTVAENIAYGAEVPIGEIHRAAQAANIHDFIMGLPDGYETNLGENASLISGGQAQRLQIARALVRRSSILILDEATSALDIDNQRAILDTIVKIKDTRTTIFITHSVEAMKRCDRIICLDEGRVAEDGPFDELVARGGVFAQLMRMGEWE